MALDAVIDSNQLNKEIKSVADTIRAKTGRNEEMEWPEGLNKNINSITGNGAQPNWLENDEYSPAYIRNKPNVATKEELQNIVNGAPEAFDTLKEVSDWIENNNKQADWNQNDETAQDYIKNRPFYTEQLTLDLFKNQSCTIKKVVGGSTEYAKIEGYCDIPSNLQDLYSTILNLGGKCKFIINTETYEKNFTSQSSGIEWESNVIPNSHEITINFLPSQIKISGETIRFSTNFEDFNCTISLSLFSDLYHQIDSKFIEIKPGISNKNNNGEIFNNLNFNQASGDYSHAEGSSTKASGDYSHAEGSSTKASGDQSHAEGGYTTASGLSSHAEGNSTIASGDDSHAEGDNTTAFGKNSHAEGDNTTAFGRASHVEGKSNDFNLTQQEIIITAIDPSAKTITCTDTQGKKIPLNQNLNACILTNIGTKRTYEFKAKMEVEGIIKIIDNNFFINSLYTNIHYNLLKITSGTIGDYSHAEGGYTTASGDGSHAEGDYTTASGLSSHAEGSYTTASGDYSHAEGSGGGHNGSQTIASGGCSHAEGYCVEASGYSAHAEGGNTSSEGSYAHCEGYYASAYGWAAHSEGFHTSAFGEYQHVQGKYNIPDTEDGTTNGTPNNKYAHVVGNGNGKYGDEKEYSNAHTLDWDGNAWYAGTVEGTAMIVKSSTPGSTKKFKITVDDTGAIKTEEIILKEVTP